MANQIPPPDLAGRELVDAMQAALRAHRISDPHSTNVINRLNTFILAVQIQLNQLRDELQKLHQKQP